MPSIVYGMWGLLVFGPILSDVCAAAVAERCSTACRILARWCPARQWASALLSAGIILAIMIIPFIASVMRDVFEVTPALLKESAYGLGSTTWEVMFKVVLPYTKGGVVGGVMLGLGRALGETMADHLCDRQPPTSSTRLSLFEAANSITSALANEFAEAGGRLAPVLADTISAWCCSSSLSWCSRFSKLLLAQLQARAKELKS